MTDIKGNPLAAGDAVSWIDMDGRRRNGWVRTIGTSHYSGKPECTVDDGAQDNPDLATNGYDEARVVPEGPDDRVHLVKVEAL